MENQFGNFLLLIGRPSCYRSPMNLFENIPANASKELFTELFFTEGVRIERIVSFGQNSPGGFWYDQPENEWVLVIEGSAEIRFEDRSVNLGPGDSVHISAGCRHRVERTDPDRRTIWLAVFYK